MIDIDVIQLKTFQAVLHGLENVLCKWKHKKRLYVKHKSRRQQTNLATQPMLIGISILIGVGHCGTNESIGLVSAHGAKELHDSASNESLVRLELLVSSHLGEDDDLIAGEVVLLDSFPEDDLGFAVRIDLRLM